MATYRWCAARSCTRTRGFMKTLETLRIFSLSVLGPALALATMFSAGIVLADPPARIGRLSYFSGTVSFSPAGDDQWAYAVLNRPVITGDRLWSDNGGRVELTLDNGAFWLGDATSIVVSNIDDRTAQFELQQGTLDFRIRRLPPGDVVEIDTPNLAFQVTRPGRYRIAVDPQSATTTVIVRNGNAEIYGEGASYVVATGQAYRFYGTDLRDSEYFTPRGVDDFERFVLERDSRFDRVMSVRYVSPEVVGYEDLDRYGSWRPVESYGNVWFPQQVPSGWAPYREGHWSWIDPWGWTWVDDAPWGFAPFHYGRWAYVESRWGWVPGPVDVRPVYAPALVAFVGGANFGVSVSSGPAIGWFPLAPREVYRPAYNVSREYYRQVNVSNTVINNTVINNTYVSNVTTTTAPVAQQVNYVNLRAPNAVTAVPPTAFAQSQPVNRVAVRLPSAALDAAQVQSMAQIAPARTAFVGAAPPARATPPAAVQQQVVVAKSPPPPAPVPVAQKLPALEKNPGKPLDRAELQANRAPGPVTVPAQNARVVNPGKPTTTAPPPAVQGDALRARTAPPIAAPPVTTAPAAPQAGTATTPTPKSETRGQPPLVPAPPTPSASERQDRRIDTRGADTGQPPRSPEALRQGSPSPSAPTVPQPPPRAADQRPASVAPPGAAQPPAPRPPEPRAIPQEQPRPVPQAQPQAQPPAPRPPEPRAIPQEQPRPVPQPQPPTPQAAPPASRAIPQEQPRPVPQAQPPTPPAAPPAARAIPQEQPRPVPQAQPQPQAQPVPAPPKPEPKPDNKRDDKKEKEKDKQG
ncbi:MAG: hypothetical protein E6H66_22440 [Betaproteobacteria bacterium]|nr:MAG: hypothetical protein E6H66_22440 [Betaproteobacteria bacterium]